MSGHAAAVRGAEVTCVVNFKTRPNNGRSMNGGLMSRLRVVLSFCLPLIILMSASPVRAATLHVNCGGKVGLTSLGAALKAVQFAGPSTINVSGGCNENVVIQNLDRLTINAAAGASINDVSGGNADTVQIASSQSVTLNNFTINGGASGVDCLLGSLCYLNGNTIQGGGGGVAVGALSRIFVSGGTLQNNGFGIFAQNGGGVWAIGVLIQQNQLGGANLVSGSLLQTDATFTRNTGSGIFAQHNSTLNCNGCNVTGNGDHGIIVRRNSTARFVGAVVITGNTGGGVLLTEESSAFFREPATVTGNTGGLDVACGASATTAKLATTNIGGGTTNCVEPVDP